MSIILLILNSFHRFICAELDENDEERWDLEDVIMGGGGRIEQGLLRTRTIVREFRRMRSSPTQPPAALRASFSRITPVE